MGVCPLGPADISSTIGEIPEEVTLGPGETELYSLDESGNLVDENGNLALDENGDSVNINKPLTPAGQSLLAKAGIGLNLQTAVGVIFLGLGLDQVYNAVTGMIVSSTPSPTPTPKVTVTSGNPTIIDVCQASVDAGQITQTQLAVCQQCEASLNLTGIDASKLTTAQKASIVSCMSSGGRTGT